MLSHLLKRAFLFVFSLERRCNFNTTIATKVGWGGGGMGMVKMSFAK